jgi:hypothetical protein
MLRKILIKCLGLAQKNLCLVGLDRLENEFVVIRAKKELSAFAPISERIFLDHIEILSQVKG